MNEPRDRPPEWWEPVNVPCVKSRAWVILAIRLLTDNVHTQENQRVVAMCPNPGDEQ